MLFATSVMAVSAAVTFVGLSMDAAASTMMPFSCVS